MIWLMLLSFAFAHGTTVIPTPVKAILAIPAYDGHTPICTVRERCYAGRCEIANDITVQPVMDYAIDNVQRNYDIRVANQPRARWMELEHKDLICNNQSQNTRKLLGANPEKLHVIFGPMCDLSIVTAGRIMGYYNIPVMSIGASSSTFRTEHYDTPTLVRTTTSNTVTSMVIDAIFAYHAWDWRGGIIYFYEKEHYVCNEVLSFEWCKNLGNDMYLRHPINFKPYTGKTKEFLKTNVGVRHGGGYCIFFFHFVARIRLFS